jgi:hypothetical protein
VALFNITKGVLDMVAVERVLWCPNRHRRYRAQVLDLGQKPPRKTNTGREQLKPEFDRVMRIKGLRREIVELLQEEGPLTAEDIAAKLEKSTQEIWDVLTRQPEFHAGDGVPSLWYLDTVWLNECLNAGLAVLTKPPAELIADHIREHGPSTSGELSKATGINDVLYHLRKGGFAVVEESRPAIWAVTNEGREAEFAYIGKSARVVNSLKSDGAQTPRQLQDRLGIERASMAEILRRMARQGYVEKIQEERKPLWGFEGGGTVCRVSED